VEVGGRLSEEGEQGEIHVLLIPATFVGMLWIRTGCDTDPLAGGRRRN